MARHRVCPIFHHSHLYSYVTPGTQQTGLGGQTGGALQHYRIVPGFNCIPPHDDESNVVPKVPSKKIALFLAPLSQ